MAVHLLSVTLLSLCAACVPQVLTDPTLKRECNALAVQEAFQKALTMAANEPLGFNLGIIDLMLQHGAKV